MPGPIVERGDRVVLRTVERADLEFVQRAYANPQVRYPMGNPVMNGEGAESAFESNSEDDDTVQFVVCRDESAAGPGVVDAGDTDRLGLLHVDGLTWRRPELAYWLAPEYHGNGYGTEAVALGVEYAFTTEATPAVEATAYAHNDASRGLLEALGFEEEGRMRKRRYVGGQYVDSVVYGLLREEWDGL